MGWPPAPRRRASESALSAPPAPVTIRPLHVDDHAAVGSILAQAYDDFATSAPHYLAWARTPRLWADDASAVFVATDESAAVVGVIALALAGTPLHERMDPPHNDAGFRLLAVAPQARGRGVAGHLVQACLDAARAAGARRIGIYSMDFMDTALRLYERMGFDRRPDLDVEFPSGRGRALTIDLVHDAAAHFPPPGTPASPPPWYTDVLVDSD